MYTLSLAECAEVLWLLCVRCIKELQAAKRHNNNIILVTKEGARWKNEQGEPIIEKFPPPHIIKALPVDVHPVFDLKPVVHTNEYYSAFVEVLMDKVQKGIKERGPSRPRTAAAHSDFGGGGGGLSAQQSFAHGSQPLSKAPSSVHRLKSGLSAFANDDLDDDNAAAWLAAERSAADMNSNLYALLQVRRPLRLPSIA